MDKVLFTTEEIRKIMNENPNIGFKRNTEKGIQTVNIYIVKSMFGTYTWADTHGGSGESTMMEDFVKNNNYNDWEMIRGDE